MLIRPTFVEEIDSILSEAAIGFRVELQEMVEVPSKQNRESVFKYPSLEDFMVAIESRAASREPFGFIHKK